MAGRVMYKRGARTRKDANKEGRKRKMKTRDKHLQTAAS
jgi:hypothetical protein